MVHVYATYLQSNVLEQALVLLLGIPKRHIQHIYGRAVILRRMQHEVHTILFGLLLEHRHIQLLKRFLLGFFLTHLVTLGEFFEGFHLELIILFLLRQNFSMHTFEIRVVAPVGRYTLVV